MHRACQCALSINFMVSAAWLFYLSHQTSPRGPLATQGMIRCRNNEQNFTLSAQLYMVWHALLNAEVDNRTWLLIYSTLDLLGYPMSWKKVPFNRKSSGVWPKKPYDFKKNQKRRALSKQEQPKTASKSAKFQIHWANILCFSVERDLSEIKF